MSLHRATRDLSAPASTPTASRRTVGPAVLFICAVLIAGLTCILYLWQQSQIVAGTQDIRQLDHQLTLLMQQRDDLLAQKQNLQSVTHVLARATKAGMVPGDARSALALQLQPLVRTNHLAQTVPVRQQNLVLPATNAAITSWWQNAWDGLYSLVQ